MKTITINHYEGGDFIIVSEQGVWCTYYPEERPHDRYITYDQFMVLYEWMINDLVFPKELDDIRLHAFYHIRKWNRFEEPILGMGCRVFSIPTIKLVYEAFKKLRNER